MFAILVAAIGLSQIPSTAVDEIQQPIGIQSIASAGPFYYGPRINMRSPLSTSVLVAQAIRAGRVQLPYAFRPQPGPYVLTCTPAPCTTPNVQASEGGNPVNETPIAVNPMHQSHMLTGGNDYNCASFQGFYASHDGGSTWNHRCMKSITGTQGAGDPLVGYDTNNIAYIGGLNFTGGGSSSEVVFETSADNGHTWSAPAAAVTGISPYLLVDKPWLQIDDTPTSPRKSSIYISTTEFDSGSNSIIAVAHSTNGGVSWTNVMVDAVADPTVDQFSDLAIGKNGTVYLSWLRCVANGPTGDCGGTTALMMFSKSLDGGVTWTSPVIMASAALAPDTCGSFYGCLPNTNERVLDVPAVDVDRSSGTFSDRLYTALYNWTGARMQLQVVRSKDHGATWSKPVLVGAGAPHDKFFPWLTTSASGTVGLTWLDRRFDPANVNYDSFATTSTDGGRTFAPGVRLSSVSSNPFNDGFSGHFMGDYTGNIWAGGILFTAWTDTRTSVAQDEVGGFKIH